MGANRKIMGCEPAKDQPGAKGEEAAKVDACTCKCTSEDEHDDACKCMCDQCAEEVDAPMLGGFDPNSTWGSAKKPDEALTERERSGINEWQGVALKDLKGKMGAQISSRIFERYDADGSGELDFDETIPMARDMLEAHPTLIQLFNECITVEKLKENFENESRIFAKEIFTYADLDGGGTIDRAEFAVFAKLLAGYKPAKDPIHDLHKSRGDDDY